MDIKTVMKHYLPKIEEELRIFLDKEIINASFVDARAKQIIQQIKEYSLRPGKRIRPILIIFGYKAFNGNNENEIIKASISIELIHSFLLIHDDIMDDDDLRRGLPTLHKVYAKKYRNDKIGESIAIIAGDIAFSFGNKAILQTNFSSKNKFNAMNKLHEAILNTGFGQLLDIDSEMKKDVNENDINKIHELKTAQYTIEAPLHIGALLAGASDDELRILSKYAIPLGRAFQIQDDILGMFGSEKKLGKPIGSDIKEGKRTLLITEALKKASPEENKFLNTCLGNHEVTEEEIEKVRTIIKKSGSLEYSQKLAASLILQAKAALSKSNFEKEAKEFLNSIADYMLKREK